MTRALLGLSLVLAVGAVAPADAETVRFSGTVTEIDAAAGSMVVEEIGPWIQSRGAHVVSEHVVALQPSTKFVVFIRVDAPGRFAGDFVEVALEATDVSPGDFVTVEASREGDRLVAVTVTVAERRSG